MPQQYSVDEFADRLRKQYPGSYDTLGSQELVDKVLEKYPMYREHVRKPGATTAPTTPTTPTPAPATPTQTPTEQLLGSIPKPTVRPLEMRPELQPLQTGASQVADPDAWFRALTSPRALATVGGAAAGTALTGGTGLVPMAIGGALGSAGTGGIYDILNFLANPASKPGGIRGDIFPGPSPEGPAYVAGKHPGRITAESVQADVTKALPQILSDLAGGAVQEGLMPAVTKAAEARMQSQIPKAVERAMKGAKALNPSEKLALSRGAETLGERFPPGTRESLLPKVTKITDEYRGELENAWSRIFPGKQIPTAQALQNVRNLRNTLYSSQGELLPGYDRLNGYLEELMGFLQRHPTMNPGEIREDTRLWSKLVNYVRSDRIGVAMDPLQEQAYGAAADGLRETINNMFPNIGAINQKLTPWINAEKILTEGELARTGATGSEFLKISPLALAAGALEFAHGGLPGGVAVTALTESIPLMNQLRKSTAFQSLSVPARQTIIDLLESGYGEQALNVLAGRGAAQVPLSALRAKVSTNQQQVIDNLKKFQEPTGSGVPLPGQGTAPRGTSGVPLPKVNVPVTSSTPAPGTFNPTTVAGATGGAQPQTTATAEDLNRKVEVIGPMGPGLISAGAFDPRKYKLVHPELDEQFLPAGGPFTADDFFTAPRRP